MPPRSRDCCGPPAPPERARVTALAQALDLAQAPRLAAHMRGRPLPREVDTLIRLAAGCRETLAAASTATRREPDLLVAAADLYLRQVVCFPGADPYRMLGVCAQAPRAEIRAHMRELVLWLHPDRNARGGDRALMQRVLDAWRAVSEPGAGPLPLRPPPAPVPARHGRRSRGYRPAWIAQPLPKARVRAGLGPRWRIGLRLLLLAAGLVVPDPTSLVPAGLAWDRDGARPEAGGACRAGPVPHGGTASDSCRAALPLRRSFEAGGDRASTAPQPDGAPALPGEAASGAATADWAGSR